MTGAEVKSLIIGNGIKLWKVAEALGVEDYYFSRRLRKPFDEEEVSKVKAAIEQVKQQEAETKTSSGIAVFSADGEAAPQSDDTTLMRTQPKSQLEKQIDELRAGMGKGCDGKLHDTAGTAAEAYLESISSNSSQIWGTGPTGEKLFYIGTGGSALIFEGVGGSVRLINPDFRINQRSKSGAVAVGEYAADMWKLESGAAEVLSDGTISLNGTLLQTIENPPVGNTICSVSAGTAAYSNGKFTITANGEIILWAKLEVGNSATPFLPPDPALELAKCQRYFVRYGTAYGWFGTGFTSAANRARISQALSVPLRSGVTRPTVTVHGTLYVNTPTKLGVDALILGDFIDSPIIQNNNLCMGFVIPDGTGTVEPCYGQLRDADSYIDISAEL